MSDLPETETGAAFAAGHAAATAEGAAAVAEGAELSAEVAKMEAAGAAQTAVAAQETAYDARAAVAGLEGQIAEIRELLTKQEPNTDGTATGAAEGTPAVPAPEKREEGSPPPATAGTGDQPSKRTGYGSGRWFGGR